MLKIMCLRIRYKKTNIFSASLKSQKKRVGSEPDPLVICMDPHQNVTDPQHWWIGLLLVLH